MLWSRSTFDVSFDKSVTWDLPVFRLLGELLRNSDVVWMSPCCKVSAYNQVGWCIQYLTIGWIAPNKHTIGINGRKAPRSIAHELDRVFGADFCY